MFLQYVELLEKYCDELEQSNKSLSNAYDDCLVTLHFWEEECCKYRKALDKACEHLVSNNICCLDICPFKGKEDCIDFCTNKDKWKEWLLKDGG